MNLTQEQANKRGYVFKNKPTVNIFNDLDFGLKLAINTAQYGRVFEDRLVWINNNFFLLLFVN